MDTLTNTSYSICFMVSKSLLEQWWVCRAFLCFFFFYDFWHSAFIRQEERQKGNIWREDRYDSFCAGHPQWYLANIVHICFQKQQRTAYQHRYVVYTLIKRRVYLELWMFLFKREL